MYLLFDMGGTKTRLAISKDGRTLTKIIIFPTTQDFDQAIRQIKQQIDRLTQGKKIKSAAGGIAGQLDVKKEGLFAKKMSVNMPGWRGKPLRKSLQKIVKVPVYLENDADLAGLGEAVYGAGRKYKIVVYLTVSTGFGGVRIVDKKIDANTIGFEPGHQIINYDDKSFAKELFPGSLESYVSGKGIKLRYHKSPPEISARQIWSQVNHILTLGILNTILFWSPDIIVLGGGMMNSKYIKIKDIRTRLISIRKLPKTVLLRKAKLGDKSGLLGALYYLKSKNL